MKDHVPPSLGRHLYPVPQILFYDSILTSLTHYLILFSIGVALTLRNNIKGEKMVFSFRTLKGLLGLHQMPSLL